MQSAVLRSHVVCTSLCNVGGSVYVGLQLYSPSIHSLSHTPFNSLTHSLTHSFIHLFIHSFESDILVSRKEMAKGYKGAERTNSKHNLYCKDRSHQTVETITFTITKNISLTIGMTQITPVQCSINLAEQLKAEHINVSETTGTFSTDSQSAPPIPCLSSSVHRNILVSRSTRVRYEHVGHVLTTYLSTRRLAGILARKVT